MPGPDLDRLLEAFIAHPFDPAVDEATVRRRLDGLARTYPTEGIFEEIELGGRPAERHRAGDGPHVLYLHGGGFVAGSPRSHRHVAARLATDLHGTVDVLDYRLAPESPFPAAIEDAVAAYAALAKERQIALVGDSAGGNLVFATAIAARDRGLRSPVALAAISPWINLGTQNDSYDLIGPVDPMLSRVVATWYATRYCDAVDAGDPRVSPLFADLSALPPTLIQVGDREVFFGDAVHLHQCLIAAGVDTELAVWKRMFHVWHLYWPDLPEGRGAIADVAAFVGAHA